MIEYFKMAFQKYADFSGRSTRPEFWWFYLANILISMGLYILSLIFIFMEIPMLGGIMMFGFFIYTLAVLIPYLAVAVRRLHDTNRSGWFLLLSLIPLVGPIILIVFWAQETYPQDNNWGPVPGSGSNLEDSLVDFDKDIV